MEQIRSFIKWWNRPNKSIIAEYAQAFIVILPIAFVIRTWGYGLYKVPTGSMETTLLVGESFVSDKFTYTFFRLPKRGEIIAFNEPRFPYSKNILKNKFQHYVWGPENWTKRVIGIPGDHVQGKVEEGKPVLYLNGNKLDEPYLNKYSLVPVDNFNTFRSYDQNHTFEEQPFYRMDGVKVRYLQKMFVRQGLPPEKKPGDLMLGVSGSDIFDVQLKTKEKDGISEYWVMGDNRLGSSDSRSFGVLNGDFIHGRIVFRLFSIDSNYSWILFDLLLHPIDFLKRVRWSRWLQTVS